uniref:Putative odorant-binding protein n=1 Tax=Corethrella appendiculata TaxID=1370023 RepID=U5EPJ3_9DIPT
MLKLIQLKFLIVIFGIQIKLVVSNSEENPCQKINDEEIQHCCNPPVFNVEIIDQCNEIHEQPGCMFECYMQSIGVFKNNQIDHEGFKKEIQSRTDSTFYDVFLKHTENCLEKSEIYTNKVDPTTKCHYQPIYYIMCLNLNSFIDCPTNLRTNDAKCQEVRENVRQCARSIQLLNE